MHKWAATFMIAAVILHQMRVFFTGAYQRPRELNWLVGMALLMCTLVVGFTGYSLVFEQLSYWGASVGGNIAEATPLCRGLAKKLLLGGDAYNEHTLSRFFILHAAVLPGAMVLLLMHPHRLHPLARRDGMIPRTETARRITTLQLLPRSRADRIDHRAGADDPAVGAGHHPAGHHGTPGRSA